MRARQSQNTARTHQHNGPAGEEGRVLRRDDEGVDITQKSFFSSQKGAYQKAVFGGVAPAVRHPHVGVEAGVDAGERL